MTIRAEDLTRDTLTWVLRHLRRFAGITQADVTQRTSELNPPFRRVLESQISDFERGRALPQLEGFLSMLVACSADGKTLSLDLLEEAFHAALDVDVDDEPSSEVPLSQVGVISRAELARLRRTVSQVVRRVDRMEEEFRDIAQALSEQNEAQGQELTS